MVDIANEMAARACLSRIMEQLAFMERIGDSKAGKVSFGDGSRSVTLDAWSKQDRTFLRVNRNLLAHGHVVVHNDGTVVITEPRDGRKHEYPLSELLALEERIDEAIYGRLNPAVDATVTCQTCGAYVNGDQFLLCGHVKYSEDAIEKSALFRKPEGGTLNIRFTIGPKNQVVHRGPGKVVLTREGMRLLLNSTAAFDDGFAQKPSRCQCGNHASADGYCRRCRPVEPLS